ncbi:MAG TPA: hypothetical protein VK541_21115 [Pedobacter sp.]|uniref:hypothetical protein n=1 Tax=Pedobacter sp. TaxID=1411316 RepID=UPI002C09152F|nr:hypothetical protein [Pedobacter sp.]HMI05000.1 hypothetical protein [Pedobacter sp.]
MIILKPVESINPRIPPPLQPKSGSHKASMRLLEKSGFHLEVIIKSGIIKNDVVMDEYLYI